MYTEDFTYDTGKGLLTENSASIIWHVKITFKILKNYYDFNLTAEL